MWGWFGHEATLRKPSDKGFPPGAAPYDGVPGAFRAPGGDLLTGNVMFFSPGTPIRSPEDRTRTDMGPQRMPPQKGELEPLPGDQIAAKVM